MGPHGPHGAGPGPLLMDESPSKKTCPGKNGMSLGRNVARHLNFSPTFHVYGPIPQAWYLACIPHIRTCTRIIRLQLGQSGSLETRTWTPETRTWSPVPKSLIPEGPPVNPSLTHPPPISLFPHLGAGGFSGVAGGRRKAGRILNFYVWL